MPKASPHANHRMHGLKPSSPTHNAHAINYSTANTNSPRPSPLKHKPVKIPEIINDQPKIVIGTFNTRGFSTISAFLQERLKSIDILGIQEHWLTDNIQILSAVSPDHSVITKQAEKTADSFYKTQTRGKGGVALFIRTTLSETCKEIPCESPRIVAVFIRLRNSSETLVVICCYLPCGISLNDQAGYLNCLASVTQIRESYPSSSTIILGDFNADTVTSNQTKKTGFILKDFMHQHALTSLTAAHCDENDHTYCTDDGRHKSSIDGFLVPTNELSLFSNTEITGDETSNTSDHLLVLTRRLVQPKDARRIHLSDNMQSTPLHRMKIKWHTVERKMIQEKYTTPMERIAFLIFQNNISNLLEDTSIDGLLQEFISAMQMTSLALPHTVLSKKKKGKPEWTSQVQAAYNTAQKARKTWLKGSGAKTGRRYHDHMREKKSFRSCLRQANAIQRRNLQKQVEEASRSDQTLFYHLIKKSKGNKQQNVTTSIEYDGHTFDGPEVILGWHKYFTDLAYNPSHLLSSEESKDCSDMPVESTQCASMKDPSTSQCHHVSRLKFPELQAAIDSLKPGKASGPDNISSEHIKHLGVIARRLLLFLLNAILQSGHCPNSMKTGIILPFHKGKGKSMQDPRNYRGITLTPTLTKLLETCIRPRLEAQLSIKDIPDQLQFGFRKGFSCQLTALCLQLTIEISGASKRPLYICFLDAEKAFDKVWHLGLLHKLRNSEADQDIQRIIRNLYNGMESQVLWDGRVTRTIQIQQGVRQGGVLSPTLYTLFVDGLIKKLRDSQLGCIINGRYSGVIVLADDVALISNTPSQLQEMITATQAYTREWRYKINPAKSAVVVMNARKLDNQQEWTMGDLTISRKDSHVHLGITKSSSQTDPTDCIISKGLHAFYALCGAGAHTLGLVPLLSVRLWNIYCIPRMLYGTSILHLNKSMLSKLNRAQTHLFKRILGIPVTAADESVSLLTGLIPISHRIGQEKLLLLGQLLDLDSTRFERRTFLHALSIGTPSVKGLKGILDMYKLPTIEDLITNPIPYVSWKRRVKNSISAAVEDATQEGAATKSSLAFWHGKSINPRNLYPKDPPSTIIRQALTIRAQLLTSTYLTRTRLTKIKKATNTKCPLCNLEEDTVVHVVAACSTTVNLLEDLIARASRLLHNVLDSAPNTPLLNTQDPSHLTCAILLPYDPYLPSTVNDSILKMTLHYLYKIHAHRLHSIPSN